jgi:hypothetical protein
MTSDALIVPSVSFGTAQIIGTSIGGTLLIICVIGIIRLCLIQKQLNPHKYKHKKSKINSTYPDMTVVNPSGNIVLRVNSMKRSKFESIKVNTNGLAMEKKIDY